MIEPGPLPPANASRMAGLSVLIYAGFALAGWAWLALRDRTSIIAGSALGEAGAVASLALGTGLGVLGAGLAALAARYLGPWRLLEQGLAVLIGPLTERQILVVAMTSGVGEEFFFRGAMQDALGPWWTALLFAAMHVGPGPLLLWPAVAGLIGLVFGQMVAAGSGLLAVSVAHALLNYLSLRRMVLR